MGERKELVEGEQRRGMECGAGGERVGRLHVHRDTASAGGGAGMGARHGASGHGGTVEKKEEKLRENPLAQNLVIAKWSRINFSYLKRAFKHCQKFYENSHRFLIT